MTIMDRERWRVLQPLLDLALELPDDQRARSRCRSCRACSPAIRVRPGLPMGLAELG